MKLVSVIIPTYNNGRSILRAIKSVQNQTYSNLEIIIVDDGSDDNTQEIIQSIRDKRFNYIRSKNNLGAGAARNEGLKISKGEYITFLDADDEWLGEKIEKQVGIMESSPSNVGICQTGAYIKKMKGEEQIFIPELWENGDVYKAHVIGKYRYLTPTFMLRRECINDIGMFDDQLRRGQDSEYLLRVFMKYKVITIPSPLAIINSEMSKSNSKEFASRIEASRLRILKKHQSIVSSKFGFITACRFRANNYRIICIYKLLAKEYKYGIIYLIKSILNWPFISPADMVDYTRKLCSLKKYIQK